MPLISPTRIQTSLQSITSPNPTLGPHTALLIVPQGQLLAVSSCVADEDLPEGEDEAGGGGDDDEEPWLDTPERLRLLLGLASQWEDDASPRVACELGRLLLYPINLPVPEVAPPNAALPAVKAPIYKSFILVLNGRGNTPWTVLSSKAEEFMKISKLGQMGS